MEFHHLKNQEETNKEHCISRLIATAKAAYDAGLKPQLVQAICEGAYGEWYEAREERVKGLGFPNLVLGDVPTLDPFSKN